MGGNIFITLNAFNETVDEVKPEDLPRLAEEVNRIIEGEYVELKAVPRDVVESDE